ncbi:2-keto-4-pentenoate hydratase/2-oxohepta-3-ene-1,7-dioic acid hydratase in catechol pathway [Paraburkholderia sp. BL23I1N1]|uniref:fumarylacetoacetate hydrolase family protein n=1 Tax=Paraburkholderia sp. BL23I1N1 TaxID=1938802 RepID=UPI000E712C85|nr:fumarylacetoacetate hydrolase family protein [Paraburkholderia sp. BL23I1N1]RKE38648.1 2-keto-4-pentenoate hydratase/2-oxohepta-3-ene-1,7-dioic acid hydratase in catechol pathway [Paraburkholderia sp. BL23I1N1]
MTFALASISDGGRVSAALRIGSTFWSLPLAAKRLGLGDLPNQLSDIFGLWHENRDAVMRVADAADTGRLSDLAIDEHDAHIVLPLQYPRKVFCVGANYADHLAEMQVVIEKVEGRAPFFFMKPATTALTGPGHSVHIPAGCSNFDWEAELVVVFGRGGRNISPEAALDHIAGYTLGIDFTARDQFVAPHLPFNFDFSLGKCQDKGTPIGPVIVPKEFVDGERLDFRLSVNGVQKQRGCTADMIYSFAEQIAGISRAICIEPGDIMFTGSPAGVGAANGESLSAGDRVVVEAEAIGHMEVVIQASVGRE